MKVLVTGSEGLVGSSVIRVLKNSPKVSSVVRAQERIQIYLIKQRQKI